MAELLKGAPVAAALNEKNAARCAALAARGVRPALAVVRVGEREDDLAYEKGVMARCGKAGVEVKPFVLDAAASQEELLAVIGQINADPAIHGCLIFRPLPAGIDDGAVRAALAPEKDVDGITDGSLAGVMTGSGRGFAPCTAEAVIEVLKAYGIPISGKRAVIVGRSLVVGRPLAMLLLKENATVTLCHTRTKNLEEECRRGEILVAAAGRARMLGGAHVGEGAVVIDVGINVDADGKLCGDVDFDAIQEKASMATPVPGGVGAVTTAVLAKHLALAAVRGRR